MLILLRPARRSATIVYSLFSSACVCGLAVISGGTRTAVTEWTWYLPVLQKATISLMLGTKVIRKRLLPP